MAYNHIYVHYKSKPDPAVSSSLIKLSLFELKYFSTSALRLIGRFITCLAQTTTASQLLFVSTRHFVLGNVENRKFSILKIFFKFCTIMMA